jgi:4-aminobutyrate aminotransferase-like enzyme/Ser/Thr protein kinase RdoA (MazF antagonist)
MADPLLEAMPAFAAERIPSLLSRTFGAAGDLQELHGERDLNFLVTDGEGNRAVLKIHNPADSAAVVDMQTAALDHIARTAPDLPVCRSIATTDGAASSTWTGDDGRPSHVRMLSFLPGHHPELHELGPKPLAAWGRVTARLGHALRGFVHPASGYEIQWDIRRFPALRRWTSALDDPRRRLVTGLLDRWDAGVAARLAGVRAQVVHNDMSRTNVLVDDNGTITGITDFGDMTHTSLICDLAVTVADVLDGRDGWLAPAADIIAGYAAVTPLEPAELALLPDLIAARIASAVTINAWRREQAIWSPPPDTGLGLLRDLTAETIDDLRAELAAAVADAAGSRLPYRAAPSAELLARRLATLGPLPLTYSSPLHLVAGRGAEVFDADGKRYLDAYNNVPVLGHSHPAVTAAVSAQLERLSTNSRYLHEAAVQLAEELLATMPHPRLDRVLLVNSGSEANDLAWRMAGFATGRQGGIVTRFAYHGVTAVTTDLSPETWAGAPAPANIRLVDPPGAPLPPGTAPRTVGDATAALAGGPGLAAMFVDGAFTSDGVFGPGRGWVRDAVAAVQGAGGLYVADEVQVGYGRTGERLWSWAAVGVEPDLVTLGKPMGNGYPVAAVVGSADIVDPFIEGTDYFSTYGGNPVACVAALAVLHALRQEDLLGRSRAVGATLLDLLRQVADRQPWVTGCRGWGLLAAVDIADPDGSPDPDTAAAVVDGARERGVLIGRTGPGGATLKIRPPLAFSAAHAEELATVLDASLTAATGHIPRSADMSRS